MEEKKFNMGQLVITPGAKDSIGTDGIKDMLVAIFEKHAYGDWGDISPEDKLANDEALENGGHLLSSYVINGVRYWIITEANRSVTTVLLPEEY